MLPLFVCDSLCLNQNTLIQNVEKGCMFTPYFYGDNIDDVYIYIYNVYKYIYNVYIYMYT